MMSRDRGEDTGGHVSREEEPQISIERDLETCRKRLIEALTNLNVDAVVASLVGRLDDDKNKALVELEKTIKDAVSSATGNLDSNYSATLHTTTSTSQTSASLLRLIKETFEHRKAKEAPQEIIRVENQKDNILCSILENDLQILKALCDGAHVSNLNDLSEKFRNILLKCDLFHPSNIKFECAKEVANHEELIGKVQFLEAEVSKYREEKSKEAKNYESELESARLREENTELKEAVQNLQTKVSVLESIAVLIDKLEMRLVEKDTIIKKLLERQGSIEPLVEVGIAVRKRFYADFDLNHSGTLSNKVVPKRIREAQFAGNKAAHSGNTAGDSAMIAHGAWTAKSMTPQKDKTFLNYFSRCWKIFEKFRKSCKTPQEVIQAFEGSAVVKYDLKKLEDIVDYTIKSLLRKRRSERYSSNLRK